MAEVSRIAELIRKRSRGLLTIQEQEELDAWSSEAPENKAYLDTKATPEALAHRRRMFWQIDEVSILRRMGILLPSPTLLQRMREKGQIKALKWSIAAATLIIIIGVGYYRYKINNPVPPQDIDFQTESLLKLQAMTTQVTRATLTINDSTEIDLDSAQEGQLLQLGIWSLVKQSKDQFAFLRIYKQGFDRHLPDSLMITISLAKDQNHRFLLSDRSRSTLYSGSSYTFYLFPYDTIPANRMSGLLGKGWFDVFHDPFHPFKIKTLQGEIRDLATTFIVQGYPGQDSGMVIQLSGKTSVSNSKGTTILNPLQEVSFTKTSSFIPVDKGVQVSDSALKDSEIFDFSRKTLPEAMEDIKRCYGMKNIRYDDNVDTTTIGKPSWGNMTRDLPLSQLLEMMTTRDMHFIIQGKTIIVSKKDYSRR